MTAAQDAQQRNRDAGGRYAEKRHSDPGSSMSLAAAKSWNAIADIDGASRDEYLAALPQIGARVWVHFDNPDLGEEDAEATVVGIDPDYGDTPEYLVRFDTLNQWGSRKEFRAMPWELYPIPAERADRFSDRALAEAEAILESANTHPGATYEEYELAERRIVLIRLHRLAAIVRNHAPDAAVIHLVDANDDNGERNICFKNAARRDGASRSCVGVYQQIADEIRGIDFGNVDVWLPFCDADSPYQGCWNLSIDKMLAIASADLDRGSVTQ